MNIESYKVFFKEKCVLAHSRYCAMRKRRGFRPDVSLPRFAILKATKDRDEEEERERGKDLFLSPHKYFPPAREKGKKFGATLTWNFFSDLFSWEKKRYRVEKEDPQTHNSLWVRMQNGPGSLLSTGHINKGNGKRSSSSLACLRRCLHYVWEWNDENRTFIRIKNWV